jgi:hypothetical protein
MVADYVPTTTQWAAVRFFGLLFEVRVEDHRMSRGYRLRSVDAHT